MGSVTIGWREWLGLPELGVARIKAKVDTGARTSALHAEDVRVVGGGRGRARVRFTVHPVQRSRKGAVEAMATLIGERTVTSSSGTRETRPVIRTLVRIGDAEWPIEITLTRRDVMGFRMLLGRQALHGQAVVDPGRSFLTRKAWRKK